MEQSYIDIPELYALWRKWLSNRSPFYHIRCNDGEWNSMFALRTPQETTSYEHHFFTDLGLEMRRVFDGIIAFHRSHPRSRILIGSNEWMTLNTPEAAAFRDYLIQHDALELPWAAGDSWYTTWREKLELGGDLGLLATLDTIREHPPVVLIGNHIIQKSQHCLGAYFIEVPRVDAWLQRETILHRCLSWAKLGATFVWCAGFCKIISWNLWQQYPQSSHLDLGNLFDAAMGNYSRDWTRRKDSLGYGSHWRWYSGTFIPYLQRFIP